MASNLSPKLRWKPAVLPQMESTLVPIERAHRIICGSLVLWSSRQIGFDWADHPAIEVVFRYCVARINGDHEVPRPTANQIKQCLSAVSREIDPLAFQALNVLRLSVDRAQSAPALAAEEKPRTDFAGLENVAPEDASDSDLIEREAPDATAYGSLGEPPAARFAGDSQSGHSDFGRRAPATTLEQAAGSLTSFLRSQRARRGS